MVANHRPNFSSSGESGKKLAASSLRWGEPEKICPRGLQFGE
jgi:hypothetical protein